MTGWLDADRDCFCHLCEPNRADDGCLEWRNGTAELITEYGWSVVGIPAAAGLPAWAFTVGLWHSLGSPEIAMFGLHLSDMETWLNELGAQIHAGQPLGPGQQRAGILSGFPLEIRLVHPSWYPLLLASAVTFYQRPPLPVVQVVWPDRAGLFPWQEGCRDNCRADQPWLWLSPEEQAPGIWTAR